MAPVHTTVTVQAFNGLEHGIVQTTSESLPLQIKAVTKESMEE